MKNLTCPAVAQVTGATHGLLPEREITAVTTDSRSVIPGCLFAAIPGEHVDGHDYITAAQKNGAVCALCEKPMDCSLPQLVVPSTETALRQIAAFYRRQFDIPFIGVTGSVGKTTAKEMIASVMSQRFNTLKTNKNYNNELGVPMTLFRLREDHEAAVVEMGISGFGEMTRLAEMVQPDTAVFTLIGDAHLEFLGSRKGVLRAKAEIVSGMGPDGVVICNGDDPLLREYQFNRKTILFGMGEGCDVRAVNVSNNGAAGMRCDIVSAGRYLPAAIPAFGQHMVYAALMGAAVGMNYGLTDEQIRQGIAAYEPIGGRSNILKTGFITLIDDCYNSNPTSAKSAVHSMSVLPGRKVCILGDMLELGQESPALHRDLGAYAVSKGAHVIACGEFAKEIRAGAGDDALWFPSVPELLEELPKLIQAGDVVLVKASRRMKFEQISEKLKELH
jgi:UDP-N-acetylmuramoyl-tripeptide--D-alanyl-D-alanine ligase